MRKCKVGFWSLFFTDLPASLMFIFIGLILLVLLPAIIFILLGKVIISIQDLKDNLTFIIIILPSLGFILSIGIKRIYKILWLFKNGSESEARVTFVTKADTGKTLIEKKIDLEYYFNGNLNKASIKVLFSKKTIGIKEGDKLNLLFDSRNPGRVIIRDLYISEGRTGSVVNPSKKDISKLRVPKGLIYCIMPLSILVLAGCVIGLFYYINYTEPERHDFIKFPGTVELRTIREYEFSSRTGKSISRYLDIKITQAMYPFRIPDMYWRNVLDIKEFKETVSVGDNIYIIVRMKKERGTKNIKMKPKYSVDRYVFWAQGLETEDKEILGFNNIVKANKENMYHFLILIIMFGAMGLLLLMLSIIAVITNIKVRPSSK